jgi:hypothetical protein
MDPHDGDIVLVQHSSLMSRAIKFGQWVSTIFHPDLRPFAWCSHSAFVAFGTDGFNLSEMKAGGHQRRSLADYQAVRYCVVHMEATDDQRTAACLDDVACSNISYGWFEYLFLFIDALTGGAFFGGFGTMMFCSQHTTQLAIALGLWPDRSPAAVFPMHQAKWFNAAHD